MSYSSHSGLSNPLRTHCRHIVVMLVASVAVPTTTTNQERCQETTHKRQWTTRTSRVACCGDMNPILAVLDQISQPRSEPRSRKFTNPRGQTHQRPQLRIGFSLQPCPSGMRFPRKVVEQEAAADSGPARVEHANLPTTPPIQRPHQSTNNSSTNHRSSDNEVYPSNNSFTTVKLVGHSAPPHSRFSLAFLWHSLSELHDLRKMVCHHSLESKKQDVVISLWVCGHPLGG